MEEKMNQLNKRITYLYNLRKELIFQVLKNYDISEVEYGIIGIIYLNEDISIKDLAEKMKYKEEIVKLILEELEKKKYITFEADIVKLSEYALKCLKTIKKDIKKLDNDFSEKMNNDEYDQILDSLNILIDYYEE